MQFFNKNNSGCRTTYSWRFVFDWLHCGVKNCMKRHVICIFGSVFLTTLRASLLFFFSPEVSQNAIQRKPFFISGYSCSNNTNSSRHLPNKRAKALYQCIIRQIKSQHRRLDKPFIIPNLSHIANLMHVRFRNMQYVSIRQ